MNNRFKTKLQTLQAKKERSPHNVSPNAHDNNRPLKTDHNDHEIDYIEVKLNRDIYHESKKGEGDNKKYKLEKVDKRTIYNTNNIIPEKDISKSTSKNIFITKVKDDMMKDDLNESNVDKSKHNLPSNKRNQHDFTIGSYTSSDVRKNFPNEMSFISNANDLENFNIKIKHSNN